MVDYLPQLNLCQSCQVGVLWQGIRQLIYGKGRAAYRIIFTILETEALSNVRILHIRHSSQPAIGEEPEEQNTN
jgi:hypothetical protein